MPLSSRRGTPKNLAYSAKKVGIYQRKFHEVAANDFGLEVGTDEVSTFKSAACCTSGGYEEFDPS